MLTYEAVDAGGYDEFLDLLREEAADYLDRTMEIMHMTWEEFARLLRTVGHLRAMRQDGRVVGYYWAEERDRTVHLHGLAVKREFQGRGIGTETLQFIFAQYRDSMDAVELGVHDSNAAARALYDKLGFVTLRRLDDLGFSIMQKPLGAGDHAPGNQERNRQRGDQ